MAEDDVKVQSPSNLVSDWQFPHQNSTSMIILDFVCKNKGITLLVMVFALNIFNLVLKGKLLP